MTTQLKNRKEGEAPNTISRYYAWVLRRGILVSMLSWWREVLIFKACFEKKRRPGVKGPETVRERPVKCSLVQDLSEPKPQMFPEPPQRHTAQHHQGTAGSLFCKTESRKQLVSCRSIECLIQTQNKDATTPSG